jgi:hypothetical protein
MPPPLSRSPIDAARRARKGAVTPRPDSPRSLVRLSRPLEEAILLVMRYVALATDAEPRQEEIAAVLRSYFTLDEVTNQINYLRKKPPEDPVAGPGFRRTPMRINLTGAAQTNCLARAGFFIRPIADALGALRKHAHATLGVAPSDETIALSLQSSFILSELKNQIVYGRNQAQAQL